MQPQPSPAFKVVALDQGSNAWLDWRRGGIGGSDAPAIMGENPWKSPDDVLREKLGLASGETYSAAMAKGVALEPAARRRYVDFVGMDIRPQCLQSVERGWLIASVDGLSADGALVVEIKCGESVYRKTALHRRPPSYYYGQLQHILAVTGLGSIDFWCYLPSRPEVHVRVARDEAYIGRLIEAEKAFWGVVQGRLQSRR
jgi:putative phage-type endonuclease